MYPHPTSTALQRATRSASSASEARSTYWLRPTPPLTSPVLVRGRTNRNKRKHRPQRKYDPHYFTAAGPLTITRADGSTETREPHTPGEVQAILKTRWSVSPAMRAKVLRRDHGRCRCCGSDQGPFEIDHVAPVALGGSNRLSNLVTACDACNGRKGAQVWIPR